MEGPGMKQVKFGEFPCWLAAQPMQTGGCSPLRGKCPHFGLPLAGGQMLGQRLRWPSTEPAFNLVSGDIEESPDHGLPAHPLRCRCAASDQMVLVEALRQRNGKFVCSARWPATSRSSHPRHFVIVGGGPAAAAGRPTACGRRATARQADVPTPCGRRPRTKLSKSMASEPVLLRTAEHYAQHDIELMLESELSL
uniref:Uncharacterized protein n=1 Tax=Macrostomum lignano TaxID=282301 RepID=A0A1I8FPD6_9PLAT